jgi:hypothetical protein
MRLLCWAATKSFHDANCSFSLVCEENVSSADLAEERILLINDRLIEAKINVHGPPPPQLEPQRAWYQETLRDSLRVASRTVFRPGMLLTQEQMLQPSIQLQPFISPGVLPGQVSLVQQTPLEPAAGSLDAEETLASTVYQQNMGYQGYQTYNPLNFEAGNWNGSEWSNWNYDFTKDTT